MWGRVLPFTLLGALAFDLVLPQAWRFARDLQTPYTATLQEWFFRLCVFLLFYFAAEPIRLPKRQIRQWHCYPPIWFAAPVGLFLVGVRELWLPCLGLRGWAVEPYRLHSFPSAWIATVLALGAVLVRYWKCSQRAEPTMSSGAPSLDSVTPASVQQWIVADERPLENHEPEFFGHRSVARKIVHLVGREGVPSHWLSAGAVIRPLVLSMRPRCHMGRQKQGNSLQWEACQIGKGYGFDHQQANFQGSDDHPAANPLSAWVAAWGRAAIRNH